MRLVLCLAAAVLIGAPAIADKHEKTAHAPGHEHQTYRFGATYNVITASDASACQSTCDGDARCRAWSYVRPVANASAYCELKRGVGSPERNPSSISGVSPRLMRAFQRDLPETDPDAPSLKGGKVAEAPAAPSNAGLVVKTSVPIISYQTASAPAPEPIPAPALTPAPTPAPLTLTARSVPNSTVSIRYNYAPPAPAVTDAAPKPAPAVDTIAPRYPVEASADISDDQYASLGLRGSQLGK